ncbi:SDR family oxidoreductase [Actinoplanes sp. TFC3]|uniref:SDR family oxidoreductase n=1 Tax=Actinoplanes sp. TFC3 TaxID=1710355 RepID=UPI00082CE625|nr:SDR family oxidoreductase [Actinoplanes sp. TFC3]
MPLSSSTRIVVIGGTSGIGLAVAHAAAIAGAQVIVGSRATKVDVTSPASVTSFFAETGPFDHLVYTAGDELVRGPITGYDPELAHRFFDVRFFRALDTVRLALPTLSPHGSITLTAGAAALRGGAGKLLGSSVGGAVIAAARSLAVELAPIRVNVVAPGLTRTPLVAGMPLDQAGAGTLLGRVAEPEDVARAYLSLMDQDYITGNVSVVDGGSVLT